LPKQWSGWSSDSLPSRISVAKHVWQTPTGTPAHGSIFLDGMNYVRENPFVWNWNLVQTVLFTETAAIWNNTKTVQDVMATIKTQVDHVLQQQLPA